MHDVKTLGADDARRGIAAVRAAAEQQAAAVVVAIADAQGALLALLRMDGARAADVSLAIAKAATAARLGESSGTIGAASRHPKSGFDLAAFGDPRIVGIPGGVPVVHGDAVVGGVGVSGDAPGTDADLAEAGAVAMLAAHAPPPLAEDASPPLEA